MSRIFRLSPPSPRSHCCFSRHPVDFTVLEDSGTLGLLLVSGVSGTIGQIFLTKAFAAGSAPRIAVIGMSQLAMGWCFDIFYRDRNAAYGQYRGHGSCRRSRHMADNDGKGNVKRLRSASAVSTPEIMPRD